MQTANVKEKEIKKIEIVGILEIEVEIKKDKIEIVKKEIKNTIEIGIIIKITKEDQVDSMIMRKNTSIIQITQIMNIKIKIIRIHQQEILLVRESTTLKVEAPETTRVKIGNGLLITEKGTIAVEVCEQIQEIIDQDHITTNK